jgi:hypothetical protein
MLHPTEPTAPHLTKMHPTKLHHFEHRGTFVSYSELSCTLLSYPAHSELGCTSTELCCTLLCYVIPYCAMLSPSELPSGLCFTPLSNDSSLWALLHPSELCFTLLATLHSSDVYPAPSEIGCIQLIYAWLLVPILCFAASYWATLQPFWAKLNLFELHCALLSYLLTSGQCGDGMELSADARTSLVPE